MRVNSKASGTDLHWHDGCTCHGSPTIQECLDRAIASGWIGKVLEQLDVLADGEPVKCYSLIAGSFDHHARRGTYVAETKIVGVKL